MPYPIDFSFRRRVDKDGKPFVLKVYNQETCEDIMVAMIAYATNWLRGYAPGRPSARLVVEMEDDDAGQG
jgi:hypothetical protein